MGCHCIIGLASFAGSALPSLGACSLVCSFMATKRISSTKPFFSPGRRSLIMPPWPWPCPPCAVAAPPPAAISPWPWPAECALIVILAEDVDAVFVEAVFALATARTPATEPMRHADIEADILGYRCTCRCTCRWTRNSMWPP